MFTKNPTLTAVVLTFVTFAAYVVAAQHSRDTGQTSAKPNEPTPSVRDPASAGKNEAQADRDETAQYIFIIGPARATLAQDATEEENRTLGEHFAYLQSLLADGKLILAGRTQDADTPVGIVIVEAESDGRAREIFNQDPAVKAGLFVGQVRPYHVALMRGQ